MNAFGVSAYLLCKTRFFENNLLSLSDLASLTSNQLLEKRKTANGGYKFEHFNGK